MIDPYKKQVDRNHYYDGYDDKKRLLSYNAQIREVLSKNPNNVLEIGPGNKFVTSYLRNRGIDVTTVDIAKDLNPDVVESVHSLTDSIDKKYDVVLCAEVLEHLPYKYLDKSLIEIKKVCGEFCIITLPEFGWYWYIEFNFPFIGPRSVGFKWSFFGQKKHSCDGEHYWEINKKRYNLKKIRKDISKRFKIDNDYLVDGNESHRLFLLKK